MSQNAAQQLSDQTVQASPQGQFLTFVLEGEEYAVNILKVQEIKSWSPVTRVPRAPSHMLGVINLRGSIVPVISLRRRFALPEVEPDGKTAVIIVRGSGGQDRKTVGLVVDQVSEVYQFTEAQIQPAGQISGCIDENFIEGLAKTDEGLVIVVNLEHIINDDYPTASIELTDEPAND